MDKKKCTAIVLSAGQGKRMGTAIQKQYIELSGKPIIFYTLDAFQKSTIIDDIVLVVGEGQEKPGLRRALNARSKANMEPDSSGVRRNFCGPRVFLFLPP